MFVLPAGRPAIMGILNVTPDSFSDGGLWTEVEKAVDHAEQMMGEGADLIDVGGESTRPGAETVSIELECQRVLPVIERLAEKRIPVSIDTRKSAVARAALEAGAVVVNDISSLEDPAMLTSVVDYWATICLMHMQGSPQTMQVDPHYEHVVKEVKTALIAKANHCLEAGIKKADIWIDPGFGFGKTVDHNLELVNHLDELVREGFPVMIGVSRKSSIGAILKSSSGELLPTGERLSGSLALQVLAQLKGARIIRTHDVQESRQASVVIARAEQK